MRDTAIGYTGQRRSGVSGSYLLGNGYRGFNPVLKRFAGQDSMSPFGAGGEHGFAYCGGNPVNNRDPSGHGVLTRFLVFLGLKSAKKSAEAEVTVRSMVRTAEADASVTHSLTLTDSAALGESSTDTALDESSGLQLSTNTADERILLGFHGTSPHHNESLMRGIKIEGEFTGSGGGTRHGTGFYISSDYGTAEGYALAANKGDFTAPRHVYAVYARNSDALENMTNVEYTSLYSGRGGRQTSHEAIFTHQSDADNLILELVNSNSETASVRVSTNIFRRTT